jgi:hypothetical protein
LPCQNFSKWCGNGHIGSAILCGSILQGFWENSPSDRRKLHPNARHCERSEAIQSSIANTGSPYLHPNARHCERIFSPAPSPFFQSLSKEEGALGFVLRKTLDERS